MNIAQIYVIESDSNILIVVNYTSMTEYVAPILKKTGPLNDHVVARSGSH